MTFRAFMRQPFKAIGAEPLRIPLAVMQLEILDIPRLGVLPPHRLKALNIRRVFDLVRVQFGQHVIAIESFDLPRTKCAAPPGKTPDQHIYGPRRIRVGEVSHA